MEKEDAEYYGLDKMLSKDDCIKIYKGILKRNSYDDDIVGEIVSITAKHKILVELLAKIARDKQFTDTELLEKLNSCGFNLSEIAEKNHGKFNGLRKTFDIAVLLYTAANDKALDFDKILNVLNKKDPDDTATTYNDIASIYHKQADYEKALNFCNKALEIREKILGKEHPDTIKIYNEIVWIYRNQGEYGKALEVYEELEKREDSNIAITYNGMAAIYRDKGNYKKALEFYDKALEKLGEKHSNTATTYNGKALVYYYQGEYDKALDFCNEALAIREEKLGKEHPDTAKTYTCMAMIYNAKGKYEEAFDLCNKALDIFQETLGDEHPLVGRVYNIKAEIYSNQSNHEKALELYDKALIIIEGKLGKKHTDIANTYNGKATAYLGQGKLEEALRYYKKALEIREEKLGKEHPDTASTYNGMAIVYRDQDKYKKAFKYYNKTLEIREKKLGKKHPDTANIYNDMASGYRGQGKYKEALDYYKKALEIREEKFGKEHIYTARIHNDMAWVYRDQGKYDYALDLYKKALEIREKILGEEHPEIARSYNNIAMVSYYQGKYYEALKYHDEALKIREKVLGKDEPDTARTYNNIAAVYQKQGKYDKASEFYNKALEIFKKKLGDKHFETITTYKNFALFHEENKNENDYRTAAKYYIEAGIKDILEMLVRFKEENRKFVIDEGLLHDLLKQDDYFNNIIKQASELKKLDPNEIEIYKSIYIKSVHIISLLYVNNKEENVAYYTEKNIAEKMFFNENNTDDVSKFRLNSINYSNDPEEGNILQEYLFEEKIKNNQIENQYRAFAGCFTLSHDCLNQFRLYGKEKDKECTGVSIVFKDSFFEESAKLATQLYKDIKKQADKHSLFRCIYIDPKTKKVVSVGRKEDFLLKDGKPETIDSYDKKIKKIVNDISSGLKELKEYIKPNLDKNIISQLLINLRYLTKHVAFKEEQECRIIRVENVKDKELQTSENKMYLEYLEIGQYVEKIYFAPNTSDMKIFQDRLLHEGWEIECEESENPFKSPS